MGCFPTYPQPKRARKLESSYELGWFSPFIHKISFQMEDLVTVQQVKACGKKWQGRVNQTLPDGEYQLGHIVIKSADVPDRINAEKLNTVRYPEMTIEGHGTLTGNQLVAFTASKTPTLSSKKTYFFPTKPVTPMFTGDQAEILVSMQGKKVKLTRIPCNVQSKFPDKPYTVKAEAEKFAGTEGTFVTKDAYIVEYVK
jgi:hypothetical protein